MMAIPPAYQETVFTPEADSDGRSWRSLLTEGELTIRSDDLLSAIWYSDGSGAHGIRSGLDSIPDDWRIKNARLVNGFVILSIERKGLE